MFDIANNTEFLTEIGINNAPEEKKAALIAGLEQLAQDRLINRLTEVMTDEQAKEFSEITDEQQPYEYLKRVVPNLQDIVAEIFSDLKKEILTRQQSIVG